MMSGVKEESQNDLVRCLRRVSKRFSLNGRVRWAHGGVMSCLIKRKLEWSFVGQSLKYGMLESFKCGVHEGEI